MLCMSLHKESSPVHTLLLAQEAPFCTSDLQNCKIIHLRTFKLLGSWQFVTAAIEDSCKESPQVTFTTVLRGAAVITISQTREWQLQGR